MDSSLVGSGHPITKEHQIWTWYPFNYNRETHEVSWSYQKCSDIYRKLYKEQKKELYVEMQTTILRNFFASLDTSTCFRYELPRDRRTLDSFVCILHSREERAPRVISECRIEKRDPLPRLPLIRPLYKEGFLYSRSDICAATDDSVCIKYIHTKELGPPCYSVCWNHKKPVRTHTHSDIVYLIRVHQMNGHWNVLESPMESLCILEQY